MSFADQLAALQTEYLDTADYSVDGDCSKARRFEAALRRLMLMPRQAFHASESISFAPETWHAMLRDVQQWIGSNCPAVTQPGTVTDSAVGGAVHFDVSDFRG
jgi:hypothetical protein